MHYRLLCVGRQARDPMLEATETFARRLRHHAKFEVVRLKESDCAREARDMLARLPRHTRVVALDEGGRMLASHAWAEHVVRWRDAGQRDVTFVVGGADGLAAAVRDRADHVWSLSPLTLPHRLAQLVCVEQLYRAHTIVRGEPYHRAERPAT